MLQTKENKEIDEHVIVIKGKPCADCSVHSKLMMDRWAVAIKHIPQVDKHDILGANPHFNGGRIRSHPH